MWKGSQRNFINQLRLLADFLWLDVYILLDSRYMHILHSSIRELTIAHNHTQIHIDRLTYPLTHSFQDVTHNTKAILTK